MAINGYIMALWIKLRNEISTFFRGMGGILACALFGLMPLGYASHLGALMGRLVFKLRGGRHKVAEHNFGIALPSSSGAMRGQLLRKMYENYGRNFAEVTHLSKFMRARYFNRIEIKGAAIAHAMIAEYGVAIFASGHFSNIHIVMAAVRRLFPKSGAIYQRHRNFYIGKFLERVAYRDLTAKFLPRHQNPVHGGIRALSEGYSLLMLCDNRASSNEDINFFGQRAQMPVGAALMSMRCRVPIIPMHSWRVLRGGDGANFVVEFGTPILPPTEMPHGRQARRNIMRDMMQDIFAHFEMAIRAHPADWLWTYNYWHIATKPTYDAK